MSIPGHRDPDVTDKTDSRLKTVRRPAPGVSCCPLKTKDPPVGADGRFALLQRDRGSVSRKNDTTVSEKVLKFV